MALPPIILYPDKFFGHVVPFTGSFTLTNDMNGKILRCDDTSNVVVTVSSTLVAGFTAGFAQYGSGTITLTPGSGATNRAGGTATSAQYQHGSLIVVKNTVGAEYFVGGDFA